MLYIHVHVCCCVFVHETNLSISDFFCVCVLREINDTGRPRCMDTYTLLGLVLHWLNGKMGQKHLQQIFGLAPATLSRYLSSGLNVLEATLATDSDGKVTWPSVAQ